MSIKATNKKHFQTKIKSLTTIGPVMWPCSPGDQIAYWGPVYSGLINIGWTKEYDHILRETILLNSLSFM